MLDRFALSLFLAVCWLLSQAAGAEPVRLSKRDLGEPFLLQINYSEDEGGITTFKTSRSRVVTFARHGTALVVLGAANGSSRAEPPRLFAPIPIVDETEHALELDLNAGFDRTYVEEDRTGEDYYGRVETPDGR
ncbi:MAG TPA: hypothetical protein VFO94_03485, partial [Gammaproteobacteria bacterium]|nr:hypothetical protein [Gammaproteobacteria bacterium]